MKEQVAFTQGVQLHPGGVDLYIGIGESDVKAPPMIISMQERH